jgi:hypothetical protein
LNALHDTVKTVSHLDGILHRAFGLFLQASSAAIPKLEGIVGGVDDRGRVASTEFAAHAFRKGAIVRKRKAWSMARSAGDGAVDRERGVVVEAATQRDGLFRERIVHWNGNRG